MEFGLGIWVAWVGLQYRSRVQLGLRVLCLSVENVACWRCPSYPLEQSHSSLQLYLYKNNRADCGHHLQVPRKSILKASLNLTHSRPSDAGESSTSGTTDDANETQTMDFTQVHGNGPRKSLARRVSFAAHTHVRLFHIQSPDVGGDKASPAPSPDVQAPAPAFVTRAENDENAVPAQASRRNSIRRRSSGAFSEFGERSMDMDMDDTAPFPHDFLPQRGAALDASAVEDDDFTDDEDDGSDMEVTEAIARNIERKRSLSMGGNRTSVVGLGGQRSSTVLITQHRSENQSPPHQEDDGVPDEGESYMEDATTSSAHTGSSYMSEGSTGEPMEFTIPVLPSMRQPKEPDPIWLQLRAVTHAGSEPYEPPPPESDDDALMIQPEPAEGPSGSRRHSQAHMANDDDDGEQDMDLTSAMTRLHNARISLGLPLSPRPVVAAPPAVEDDSFEDDGQVPDVRDDTFSTDDSFGNDSADMNNQTINFTQRTSLATTEDSSMDDIDALDGVVKLPISPGSAPAPQGPSLAASTSQAPAITPFRSSVFSAPLSSSVFSAPPPATASKPSTDRPHSPAKSPGPATVPKPFVFSLPRAGSPSKTATQGKTPSQAQPHKGTAAFAPPTVPKSPKRPESNDSANRLGTAARPTPGRLSPSRTAAFAAPVEPASQPVAGPNANRRASISAVRRTSGYFAQRKSLGGGVLPPAQKQPRAGSPEKVSSGAGLNKPRASVGGQPSSVGLGLPLARTQSDPGSAAANRVGSIYPDLSQLSSEEQHPTSPAPSKSLDKGTGRTYEREEVRQGIPAPSPTRGYLAPASQRVGSPVLPQRVASPVNVPPPRGPPATHTGKASGLPQVIDVSMAMDVDMDAAEPPPPTGAGVSQSWREGVPEEPMQDDDGVSTTQIDPCKNTTQ